MITTRKKRTGLNPVRILNSMRAERKLPTVNETKPVKITKELIRQVTLEAWKKYPQVFTDPYYQLGEMTLELVEQDIKQHLDDFPLIVRKVFDHIESGVFVN